MLNKASLRRYFLLALVVTSVALTVVLISPFWTALLMAAVLGSIYSGIATATEAAAIGVLGALALAGVEGSLDWRSFTESLNAACRQFSAIALILAGAAGLTLTMGYLGLPRDLAAAISALELSPWQLIAALLGFYVVLGCFLDGISVVVLTVSIIMPTVTAPVAATARWITLGSNL